MGMYIAISRSAGWGTSGGVFDCIVEATRKNFNSCQAGCMSEIYRPLDEQGQSFIALDEVDAHCFKIFYENCKLAMEGFSNSERGRFVPRDHIPGILWNWSEVLRLMREDPRFLMVK